MQRLIIVYGIIAGVVIIGTNIISSELGFGQAWLGFLVMFIAFSTIFVAIKQHRDKTLGGKITFAQGLGLGAGITAIASCCYVGIWEIYQAFTGSTFAQDYAASAINAAQDAGVSEAELVQLREEMETFKAQYANIWFRIPMTLLEVFPIGIVVSLVSAAVLRNHNPRNHK